MPDDLLLCVDVASAAEAEGRHTGVVGEEATLTSSDGGDIDVVYSRKESYASAGDAGSPLLEFVVAGFAHS